MIGCLSCGSGLERSRLNLFNREKVEFFYEGNHRYPRAGGIKKPLPFHEQQRLVLLSYWLYRFA